MSMTINLEPDKTIVTIDRLANRIADRFPDSGIHNVCKQLCKIAKKCKAKSEQIAKPNYILRFCIGVLVFGGLGALLFNASLMQFSLTDIGTSDLFQIIDSGIGILVFVGAAVFFLFTAEIRLKRSRAIEALHELRAIAHVIDMQQLTKDPSTNLEGETDTPSSPERKLSPFELSRYLDYCSEMLALTGKVAAIYGNQLRDPVVLASVNDVENLTTNLSSKVWQKIVILNSSTDRSEASEPRFKVSKNG